MPNRHAPQTTIITLNNDVLLNIFHWYQLENMTDGFDGAWNLGHWWYKLIHVCQTWRQLILASPTRLDLHLVCTYGTPITTMLTYSPPLPLIIYYGRHGDAVGKDKQNVLFALQHRERVRRVYLTAPEAASLPTLLNAMDSEYPVLQCLVIRSNPSQPSSASNKGIALPVKLQTPLLRHLTLSNVRLPVGSELLLRAECLVTLDLIHIADTPEFHPAHLVTQLARMTQLERFVVKFRTALPSRAVSSAHTTRTALPRLKLLSFSGSSAYLEGMLARLSAPALQMLLVDLFAQLAFDLPFLERFARAAGFQFHTAELHFDADTACVLLDLQQARRTVRTNPVQLRVSCRTLDWQLAALAQICGALAPLFARVEGLTLGLHVAHANSGILNSNLGANSSMDVEPDTNSNQARWHEPIRAFGSTKTLQLAGPRAVHLPRELLPLPADLLPALQELLPGDGREPGIAEDDPLAAFIAEREAAGCPVRIVHDWW